MSASTTEISQGLISIKTERFQHLSVCYIKRSNYLGNILPSLHLFQLHIHISIIFIFLFIHSGFFHLCYLSIFEVQQSYNIYFGPSLFFYYYVLLLLLLLFYQCDVTAV